MTRADCTDLEPLERGGDKICRAFSSFVFLLYRESIVPYVVFTRYHTDTSVQFKAKPGGGFTSLALAQSEEIFSHLPPNSLRHPPGPSLSPPSPRKPPPPSIFNENPNPPLVARPLYRERRPLFDENAFCYSGGVSFSP